MRISQVFDDHAPIVRLLVEMGVKTVWRDADRHVRGDCRVKRDFVTISPPKRAGPFRLPGFQEDRRRSAVRWALVGQMEPSDTREDCRAEVVEPNIADTTATENADSSKGVGKLIGIDRRGRGRHGDCPFGGISEAAPDPPGRGKSKRGE